MVRLMEPLQALFHFGVMSWNESCTSNCSGHGECLNGTCLCEIQFDGEGCTAPNLSYFISFASVFFLLAFVCMAQLIMCVTAEFQRMKAPSFARACRITTQKLIYFVVFLAAIIRGAYFASPAAFAAGWSHSLMSAYYPLLLSGSSLIVCCWAELFHLPDIRCESPRFLSKSFLGFVVFNVITYSLLLAEFIVTSFSDTDSVKRAFYTHIFNGCYAVLMFIVVIFFLIYGVEVYFKVRGQFLREHQARRPLVKEKNDPAAAKLLQSSVRGGFAHGPKKKVDTSQLHQSRLGLVSQAFMLIVIVGFLFSETLSELWKEKVPVESRNWHDVLFRVMDFGVALWFPCVLWNCMRPEQLWILNPKKILQKLEGQIQTEETKDDQPATAKPSQSAIANEPTDKDSGSTDRQECFICYDPDRVDAGPLIQPCQCRGDVSTVHHNCLRRWLVESGEGSESLHCKVCGTAYQVKQGSRLVWGKAFTIKHWLQTAALVTIMCVTAAGAWTIIQLFTDPWIRMLAAGGALLIYYVCIRFLGLHTVTAYQRAKVSAMSILSRRFNTSQTAHLSTISETVAVDIQASGMPKVTEARI